MTLAWPRYRAVLPSPRPIIGMLIALPSIVILPLAWYITLSDTRGRSYLLWYQWFGLVLLSLGWFVSLAGFHATRRLLFPLLVLVLSLPVPSFITNPLQTQLQEITAVSSEATLKVIGEKVTRRGFVLTLPQGELGVAEACSGVKSLFSLAALGAFLASCVLSWVESATSCSPDGHRAARGADGERFVCGVMWVDSRTYRPTVHHGCLARCPELRFVTDWCPGTLVGLWLVEAKVAVHAPCGRSDGF